MVMKIKAKDFIKKLDECPKDLASVIAVLLDNANDLTADELRKFHLPAIDVVAKIEAKKIRVGFVPLQPVTVIKPEKIDDIKNAHLISKHDATLLAMDKCIENNLATAKNFIEKVELAIFSKTELSQKRNQESNATTMMGITTFS